MAKSTGAARRWISKSEVDYYTYFLTSWITFNAWFGIRYKHSKERDKIEKIKEDVNDPFHKAINDLLESNDTLFLQYISDLHFALLKAQLSTSHNKSILFDEIISIDNPNLPSDFHKNQIRYHLRIEGENLKVDAIDRNKKELFKYEIPTDDYCEQTFSAYLNRKKISVAQRKTLATAFKQASPKVKQKVIENAPRPTAGEYYNAPKVKFKRDNSSTNDKGHIVIKALVEILYQLRNLLVHGELEPTENSKLIYQHAYLIMQMLLPSLTR